MADAHLESLQNVVKVFGNAVTIILNNPNPTASL